VLKELRAGHRNAEIGARLGISINTVRYHVSNILGKLEQPNRAALRELPADVARGRWSWLGAVGVGSGRDGPGVGALIAVVGVAVMAAGLLVVAYGGTAFPSLTKDESVAVPLEGEPPDYAAAGGTKLDAQIESCFSPYVEGAPGPPTFGPMLVPSDLVELSSVVGLGCHGGFGAGAVPGERDYDLAISFPFNFGKGEERAAGVWWVFYPEWDDPHEVDWGINLRKFSPGGTISYHDGYVVVVAPDVSDEVRRAAEATPDTDIWHVVTRELGAIELVAVERSGSNDQFVRAHVALVSTDGRPMPMDWVVLSGAGVRFGGPDGPRVLGVNADEDGVVVIDVLVTSAEPMLYARADEIRAEFSLAFDP